MKVSRTLLALVIALLPLLYLNFIWMELPEQVPVHFDSNGHPDRYSSRSGFYAILFMMTAISIGSFFLVKLGQKMKMKQQESYTSETLEQIGLGVCVFVTAVSFIAIRAAISPDKNYVEYILLLVPLLLVFLGNYMIRLRPNYFVGIRTFSTLSSEENWRKTHRLAGRLMVVCGLASIIPMLYLPNSWKSIVLVGMFVVSLGYPIIYSMLLARKS